MIRPGLFRQPGLFRLFVLGVLCGLFHVACGQKGPPLAPIVYLPRPVSEVVAKRIENDIVLQFTVPTVNTDNSGPADLRRIEVYAHTGPLPKPEDFLKYGTLVASIPIKQPPEPEEERPDEDPVSPKQEAEPAAKADAEGKVGPFGVAPAAAPDVAGSTAPLAGATASDAATTTPRSADLPSSPEASADRRSVGEGGQVALPAEAQSAKAEPVAPKQAGPVMIEQGWTTTVRETLTPKHMEIGPMPPTRPVPVLDDAAVVVEKIETPGTINFDLPPQRFYTIVGVSESRNKRGPFAGPIPVALLEPLSPPEKIDVDYTAEAISLMWPGQPEDIPMTGVVGLSPAALGLSSGAQSATADATGAVGAVGAAGAVGAEGATATTAPAVVPEMLAVLDRETEDTFELYADVETEGTEDALVGVVAGPALTGIKPAARVAINAKPPTPRYGYNVYEAGAMGETGATGATSAPTAPIAPNVPITPLNARLLTSPGFMDPRVEFGVERCYILRRVEMVGTVGIESAPSSPTCVTPVDTFPPAPPKSLAHIAGGNGVSLLWEANTEPDLGGYLVLRGEAPGDKLSPLTNAPITDTSFLDTTARRGRTYVYEVVAVDQSTPPNQSAPSNRVEETIR